MSLTNRKMNLESLENRQMMFAWSLDNGTLNIEANVHGEPADGGPSMR